MPWRCLRLRRRPAVSTRTNVESSRCSTVSIESRVVPGTSDTMTRSRPTSAFRSDDLPTFGRPRIATLIASSPTGRSPRPGSRPTISSRRSPVPVQRGDRNRVTEPEPVELERLEVAARVVELVGEDEHRAPRHAQDLGELLVARSDSRPRVDDEEHEVRLLDRLACLRRDLRA